MGGGGFSGCSHPGAPLARAHAPRSLTCVLSTHRGGAVPDPLAFPPTFSRCVFARFVRKRAATRCWSACHELTRGLIVRTSGRWCCDSGGSGAEPPVSTGAPRGSDPPTPGGPTPPPPAPLAAGSVTGSSVGVTGASRCWGAAAAAVTLLSCREAAPPPPPLSFFLHHFLLRPSEIGRFKGAKRWRSACP